MDLKWKLIIIAVVSFLVFGGLAPVIPDKDGQNITVFEWIQRRLSGA